MRRSDVREHGRVADRSDEDGQLARRRRAVGGPLVEDVQPLVVHGPGRAGAASRLEHHGVARAETQHGPAGSGAREARRGIVADDITGVGRVVQPQRHAEVGVGADLVVDHAGRPLGGQHEVDAEAAAALGDADERRQERRQLRGQGGELVDHDHEARQRRSARLGPVGGEIGRADLPQQLLAPPHLGVQAAQRPLGQAVVEIGHHADGVRQLGAGVERRPALVIDEHEREVVGAVARRQRHHERPQQLALAGPGRAGEERVRAVPDEIDVDDPVGSQPERHRRRRIGSARPPCRAAMAMASSIGPVPNCSHSSPSVTDLASASAAERRVLRVAHAGQHACGVPGVGEGEAGDVDGRRSPGLADRGVRIASGPRRSNRCRGRCGTSPARCLPRARAPPRRPTVWHR